MASGNRRSIKLSNLSSSSAPIEDMAAPLVEETPAEEPAQAVSEPEAEDVVAEMDFAAAIAEAEASIAAAGEAIEAGTPIDPIPETPEEEPVPEPVLEAAPEPVTEPEPEPQFTPAPALADMVPPEPESIDTIVEHTASVAEALAEMENQKQAVEAAQTVSDEVGIIAAGTRIHGNIITDGHLEINGVVEGSISARGNVRVNGDVYGDIACGNLIIKEGTLKINVQAREDISLGAAARIEGDIRCRKIGIEGTVVGNITATEMVQITGSASINGNIITSGIAIGNGAKVNSTIKMVDN